MLVILFTGFGLISGHVFARGVQYLASNAASALGRKAYSMGAEFEDSEADIKVKYRAEYWVKKAALEKEWENGKITAKVYEEKRKALDKEYEQALKQQPTVVQAAPPPTIIQAAPPSIPPPQVFKQEASKVITIDAQRATWTNSGIQVKKGDTIRVEASGTIDHGRPKCGPDGNPNLAPYGDAVMPTARYGALIGKIGASEPFIVGSAYQATVAHSGAMQFLINDTPGNYYDNSGYFQVRIVVTRNQYPAAPAPAVAACPAPSWSGDTLNFPACHSGQWFDIGMESITLFASGTIDHGGKQATPLGSEMRISTQLDWCGLADRLPLAALVAKVGENGRPFVVQNGLQISSGGQHIYVGINDSDASDNRGQFTIVKRK